MYSRGGLSTDRRIARRASASAPSSFASSAPSSETSTLNVFVDLAGTASKVERVNRGRVVRTSALRPAQFSPSLDSPSSLTAAISVGAATTDRHDSRLTGRMVINDESAQVR